MVAKTKQQLIEENHIVVSADGRLCVSGAARSNLVAALSRLRAMPADVTALMGECQTTVSALEAALATPAPLEVSTYYELVASFEDAMAQAMQLLHEMAPPDEESPRILATRHQALARSQCFRFFAKSPIDDASARAYLLEASGLSAALQDSLNTPERVVLPAEGEGVARTLRTMADRFGAVQPALAQGATSLAAQLDSESPLPLSTFFEHHAQIYEDLCAFFMNTWLIHRAMPEAVRPAGFPNMEEELQTRGAQHAMAGAACGLLVSFFIARPTGGRGDEPRLILN